MELMKELGKLAKERDLHIQVFTNNTLVKLLQNVIVKIPLFQTHISENVDEVKAVRNIFKEYPSYASVYNAAGLLTNKVNYKIYIKISHFLIRFKNLFLDNISSCNTPYRG